MSSFEHLRLPSVSDAELGTIKSLLTQWEARLSRNLQRTVYYDGEQAFKDLGLMLPHRLRSARFYLGWATMAVRKAAIRSQFDGLRLPGVADPFDLGVTLEANAFPLEFSQAVMSAYKHGVSFVTVAGDSSIGAQIQAHSAETATAIWDARTRSVASALTISELDDEGKPSAFLVYLPGAVLTCERSGGSWSVDRQAVRLPRVPVVPVTYDPQITAPFGRSRISRPVMALTDMAVRAYVRMEGNAEFYSSPQLAVEGIDPDAFDNATEQRKFKLAMDRLVALSRDADGNAPTIKQLQQATMTPHSDMLRTVAMAFSGETGIPPSSLGIIHDNPSSAEAIRAAEHDLLIDVQYQNKFVLSSAVKQIATFAVMARDNLTEAPADAWRLSSRFVDPEFRSASAAADAVMKLSAHPKLQSSSVPLEMVFDQEQLERIESDSRRVHSASVLDRLTARGANDDTGAAAEA